MFITTDELEERIIRLERLLVPQFILIKDAVIKYGVSDRTIRSKMQLHHVRKLRPGKGKNNPLLEADLIIALQKVGSKPRVFNKKKG